MNRHRLAIAAILWVALALGAFEALRRLFAYPDVLRFPAGDILARFDAGGVPLIAAWAAFALAAALFAPLAAAIERTARLTPHWSGRAAALAQAIGLARWVVIVPFLASAHALPWLRDDAQAAFRSLHAVLGVGLGEIIGQLLLCIWTARVGHHLTRAPSPRARALGWAGLLTVPLWLAGLSDPLATLLPQVPVLADGAFAFMAFEAWVILLALFLPRLAPVAGGGLGRAAFTGYSTPTAHEHIDVSPSPHRASGALGRGGPSAKLVVP